MLTFTNNQNGYLQTISPVLNRAQSTLGLSVGLTAGLTGFECSDCLFRKYTVRLSDLSPSPSPSPSPPRSYSAQLYSVRNRGHLVRGIKSGSRGFHYIVFSPVPGILRMKANTWVVKRRDLTI